MDAPVTWRNRTQNSQTQTRATRRTYSNNFPAGPTESLGSTPTGVEGITKLMSDNPHPDFKRRIREGQIIMGDMSLQKQERRYSPAALSYTIPPTYEYSYGGDFASQVITAVNVSDAISAQTRSDLCDAALIEAYAKITKESVMSSEILVGLARTINMLRSPFASARWELEKYSRGWQTRAGKSAASVTKAKADSWLEYRYGMLPLYLDVNQIIDNFSKGYRSLEKRRIVVRSHKELYGSNTVSFTGVALPVLSEIGSQFYASGSASCQHSLTADGGVMYDVEPRTVAEELAVQFQLGTSAILPSLWEQIPFSFVADWFFNVGDWLAANNLPPGVTVKANWVTSKEAKNRLYNSSELYTWMNSVKRSGSWGSGSKIDTIVQRMTNRPLPPLPVVTDKWSTITHALDAASLLLGPVKALASACR